MGLLRRTTAKNTGKVKHRTWHWSNPGTVLSRWKVLMSQTSELLTISRPLGWKTPFMVGFSLSSFLLILKDERILVIMKDLNNTHIRLRGAGFSLQKLTHLTQL